MNVIEAHRIWAATYDATPNPLIALEQRMVRPLLGDLRGKRFLDAGCGTGRWLAEAEHRGAKAIGIDLCYEMLAQARGRPLALGDVRRLPFPDRSMDMVLCAFCLSYVDPPDGALAELARVLQPGGALICSDMHPEAYRHGWTRSFRAGGGIIEIDSRPMAQAHSLPGLELIETLEPRFGEPERSIFDRAGKSLAEASRTPAILIARWRRVA